MAKQHKSLPEKGQAFACNTWQPGYHNALSAVDPWLCVPGFRRVCP